MDDHRALRALERHREEQPGVEIAFEREEVPGRPGQLVELATALAELGRWKLEIVKRPDTAEGFVILPRR